MRQFLNGKRIVDIPRIHCRRNFQVAADQEADCFAVRHWYLQTLHDTLHQVERPIYVAYLAAKTLAGVVKPQREQQ